MTARSTVRLLVALVIALGVATTSHAAEPLAKEVTLAAAGGATFKAPEWKQTRSDEAVVVLERQADADKKIDFGVLVLAIEEGPKKTDSVDWDRIRDNILASAKDAGGTLELAAGDEFTKAAGLAGRRFTGTIKNGDRVSAVEMVALVGTGVMVTVTAIGPKASKTAAGLAEGVAATTALEK